MKFGKYFVGAITLLAFTVNSPQVLANGDGKSVEPIPTEVPEGVPRLDDDDTDTYDFSFDEEGTLPRDFVDNDKNSARNDYDKNDYDFNDDYGDDDFVNDEPYVVTPRDDNRRILPPSRINTQQPQVAEKSLKQIKTRFVKLAVDDNYTYYLDKQSVSWKRMPYSASEYIADVWVRMIEHTPDYSDMPNDLTDYLDDDFSQQIEFAREKGYKYSPVDVEVLKHKRYLLEHYYLRPKTQQIQFISELEVFGHPQNTITERAYEYKNWEYLIPDSVESIIYTTTIKEIGKSKASERGHMTFTDMLEEYGRISIR